VSKKPSNVVPFNPLERKHLGASVADALLAQKAHPLHAIPTFAGVGIYAIYYVGKFAPYQKLRLANRSKQFTLPIYVGKAVPKGARKGGGTGAIGGKALSARLAEHAESINLATNLDHKDFFARYLVVEDIWIPLGESLLIAKFAPLWNVLIDGFGNHDPGKGRYNGLRPRWDVLHPGRTWALKCAERSESATEIARDAASYLDNIAMPVSPFVEVDPVIELDADDEADDA
jgi:Eco29kI restriction endonuclease